MDSGETEENRKQQKWIRWLSAHTVWVASHIVLCPFEISRGSIFICLSIVSTVHRTLFFFRFWFIIGKWPFENLWNCILCRTTSNVRMLVHIPITFWLYQIWMYQLTYLILFIIMSFHAMPGHQQLTHIIVNISAAVRYATNNEIHYNSIRLLLLTATNIE